MAEASEVTGGPCGWTPSLLCVEGDRFGPWLGPGLTHIWHRRSAYHNKDPRVPVSIESLHNQINKNIKKVPKLKLKTIY